MTEVDVKPCVKDANDYCNEKKFGFMVDMNPQRALTNVILFSENMGKKKTNETTDVQQYRQITDLINIDEDVLHDKYGDKPTQEEMDKFGLELFNKLHAAMNANVNNVKKIIGKFSFDPSKLEALGEELKKINISKQKTNTVIQEPDEDESITSGKKREKIGTAKQKEKEEKKKKEKEEKEINLREVAAEIISEFISLLNIFTLYSGDTGAK